MQKPRVPSFSLSTPPSSPPPRSPRSTHSSPLARRPLVIHAFLPTDPRLGPLPLCPLTLELLLYRRLLCVAVEFVWETRLPFSSFLSFLSTPAAAGGDSLLAASLACVSSFLRDPAPALGALLLGAEGRETRVEQTHAQPPWALDSEKTGRLLVGRHLREEIFSRASSRLQEAESPFAVHRRRRGERRSEGRGRNARREKTAREHERPDSCRAEKTNREPQNDASYACLVESAVGDALDFYLWTDNDVFSNFTLPLLTHSLGAVDGRLVAYITRTSRLSSLSPSSLSPRSSSLSPPACSSSSTPSSNSASRLASSLSSRCGEGGQAERSAWKRDSGREESEGDKRRGKKWGEEGENHSRTKQRRRADEAAVLKNLQQAICALASLLEQRGNVFFGGKEGKPCLLDIRAFVFFAVLFSIPLPDRWHIEEVLLGSPGSSALVQFCLRMHGAFPVWPGEPISFLFGVRSSVARRTLSREKISLSPQLDALCKCHRWRRGEREESKREHRGEENEEENREEKGEGASDLPRGGSAVRKFLDFANDSLSLCSREVSTFGGVAMVLSLTLLTLYATKR
ncbi:hypothetical protein TGP89_255440 [Toxoplasma gondii p89]|uniref:Metaxin glutathione S-transferase domain-containing protein n=1 Tax=Toxoplasma gondii p89 TaxID=943119 RepID=A0A086L1N5_TOXGO|nr:hypothetical protein TGP89_255440 [Toxoplasma gondii p89]